MLIDERSQNSTSSIVRGGEWSFKNNGSRKILVGFHGSRSLVFLAVICGSRCLDFFIKPPRSPLDFLQG